MNEEAESDFNYIRELKRMISDHVDGCKTKAQRAFNSLLYVTTLLNLLSNLFVIMFLVNLGCKMMWIMLGFVIAYVITLSFTTIFSFIKMNRIIRSMEVYKSREVLLDKRLLKLSGRMREYEDEGNTILLAGISTEPKLSWLITEYMQTMGSIDVVKFKLECYFSLSIVAGFTILYALCFGALAYSRFCGGNNTSETSLGQGGLPLPS